MQEKLVGLEGRVQSLESVVSSKVQYTSEVADEVYGLIVYEDLKSKLSVVVCFDTVLCYFLTHTRVWFSEAESKTCAS